MALLYKTMLSGMRLIESYIDFQNDGALSQSERRSLVQFWKTRTISSWNFRGSLEKFHQRAKKKFQNPAYGPISLIVIACLLVHLMIIWLFLFLIKITSLPSGFRWYYWTSSHGFQTVFRESLKFLQIVTAVKIIGRQFVHLRIA